MLSDNKDTIDDIKNKLKKEPQSFDIFDVDGIRLTRWYDGDNDMAFPYTLEIDTVNIALTQKQFDVMNKSFKSTTNQRNLVMTMVFGMLVGEKKGNLSFEQFNSRFKTMCSLFNEFPEMNDDDKKHFEFINKLQMEMLDNLVDLLGSKKLLPEFVVEQYLKIADLLGVNEDGIMKEK